MECALYRNSNKEVLSVGGHIFLSDSALEAIVAEAIAEKVAKALHSRLGEERFDVFNSLFYEITSQSHFEKIISKIELLSPLNVSTNTFLILRKYFSEQREFAPDLLRLKAGYYCYEDPKKTIPTVLDKNLLLFCALRLSSPSR